MYPLFICEDNPTQLQHMVTLVNHYTLFHDNTFHLTLATSSPRELLDYVVLHRPTKAVYILDIDLNHSLNGIDVAQQIREHDPFAKIIFITTKAEMAPLTLKRKVEALHFIIKSDLNHIRDELYEGLTLAYERLQHTQNPLHKTLSFTVGSRQYNIDLPSVICLETSSVPHRLKLMTTTGVMEFYGKLSSYANDFPEFLSISKSIIVNPTHITEVNYKEHTLTLANQYVVPFAYRKAKIIKDCLQSY